MSNTSGQMLEWPRYLLLSFMLSTFTLGDRRAQPEAAESSNSGEHFALLLLFSPLAVDHSNGPQQLAAAIKG
ncbi:hypothetical protein BKA93DRAFT_807198 [Sparassis latifolia]